MDPNSFVLPFLGGFVCIIILIGYVLFICISEDKARSKERLKR